MVDVPEDEPFTEAELAEWYKVKTELNKLKQKEGLLRHRIFGKCFPNPKVGINNYDLSNGYVLKGKYEENTSVDEGAFGAIAEQMRGLGVNPDDLIRRKPELNKTEYKKLNAEQKLAFDQCLTVKPGSKSLEVVLPAKNKPKEDNGENF